MSDGLSVGRTIGLVILATFIAPAFAPTAGVFVLALLGGDPGGALLTLPLAPMLLLTVPGIYGYMLAFAATLLLGLPLAAAAFAIPSCQRVRLWFATGAVGGVLISVLFWADAASILADGTAGAVCALVYRWIVGFSFDKRAIEQTA